MTHVPRCSSFVVHLYVFGGPRRFIHFAMPRRESCKNWRPPPHGCHACKFTRGALASLSSRFSWVCCRHVHVTLRLRPTQWRGIGIVTLFVGCKWNSNCLWLVSYDRVGGVWCATGVWCVGRTGVLWFGEACVSRQSSSVAEWRLKINKALPSLRTPTDSLLSLSRDSYLCFDWLLFVI